MYIYIYVIEYLYTSHTQYMYKYYMHTKIFGMNISSNNIFKATLNKRSTSLNLEHSGEDGELNPGRTLQALL